MNSIVQIVRQKIWWILLALVILGLFFFRHSIFGFKEGMDKLQTQGNKGNKSNNDNMNN